MDDCNVTTSKWGLGFVSNGLRIKVHAEKIREKVKIFGPETFVDNFDCKCKTQSPVPPKLHVTRFNPLAVWVGHTHTHTHTHTHK